jgi:hypothetical protein
MVDDGWFAFLMGLIVGLVVARTIACAWDAWLTRLFTARAIQDGGFDLSPCGNCGTPVVCIPDGLPMCRRCATADEG